MIANKHHQNSEGIFAMSQELRHLFKAIHDNHLEQVKVVIKKDRELVNSKDAEGNTALLMAAQGQSADIVDALVKHGASLNYKHPETGVTALMIAAKNGRLEIAKLLLNNGADPKIADAQGKKALDYAKQSKNQHLIELFQ